MFVKQVHIKVIYALCIRNLIKINSNIHIHICMHEVVRGHSNLSGRYWLFLSKRVRRWMSADIYHMVILMFQIDFVRFILGHYKPRFEAHYSKYFALSTLIKRGRRLTQVHNVQRPSHIVLPTKQGMLQQSCSCIFKHNKTTSN